MKRYITISRADYEEVAKIIRNAVITNIANDAYNWFKQQLANRQIKHNDQQASHQSQLPHQGGYVSFYLGPDGRWASPVQH